MADSAAPNRVLWRRLPSAIDTDRAFTMLFGDHRFSFWLDSSLVEPGRARFSFLGHNAGPLAQAVQYDARSGELAVLRGGVASRSRESIFSYLERELERGAVAAPELPFDFTGGFVGYFGYELKGECGARHRHRSPVPDAGFLFADRLLAVDHEADETYLVCVVDDRRRAAGEEWLERTATRLAHLRPAPEPAVAEEPVSFRLQMSHAEYLARIDRCLHHIREGESYEICLTNQLLAEANVDPLAVYRHLRRVNPAPYAAYLRFGDFAVACSSPERFLRIGGDRQVESKPIKGTRPCSADPARDRALRTELRDNDKDRAENLMIVDLLRNDLGRVCEIGSVHVPRLMEVESYPTVHQLVSTVRGRLRHDVSAVECVRHAFPGGSMTGAPKLRTMEIIDDLEPVARGVYSGSIGYLSLSGAADLNIVIRSIVAHGRTLSTGVGGAIIALSDPEEEFQETLVKARAQLHAVLRSVGADLTDDGFERLCQQLRRHGGAAAGRQQQETRP